MITHWFSLALLCLAVNASDFNWCYNCFDLNANQTWCRGANDLTKNRKLWQGKGVMERLQTSMYGVQRCGSWYPYCVIQEVMGSDDGGRFQYRRECSNGQDFSFIYTDGKRFSVNITGTRLTHVLPNGTQEVLPTNRTVCLWSAEGRSQVCLTICSGDFCNGPQPETGEDEDGGAANSGSDVTVWCIREFTRATSTMLLMTLLVLLLTSRTLGGS